MPRNHVLDAGCRNVSPPRFNEAEARASESHPIPYTRIVGRPGFNEAEARASESHPALSHVRVRPERFNEAEARASESLENLANKMNIPEWASMRPRRVPRNHFPRGRRDGRVSGRLQ